MSLLPLVKKRKSYPGINGRKFVIYGGRGLLDQMQIASREYYTDLTTDILEDFLYELSGYRNPRKLKLLL